MNFLKIFAILATSTLWSCESKDEGKGKKADRPVQINPNQDSEKIVHVDVDTSKNEPRVEIGKIPEGGQLSCELNGEELKTCENGMKIDRPKDGDYQLIVRVKKDDQLLSYGEVRFRVGSVTPTTETSFVDDRKDPLYVSIDDVPFINGSAVTVDNDLAVKLKFPNDPKCQASLRCRLDNVSAAFSPLCTDSSLLVKKDMLAFGLQYGVVQAQCGEKFGPKLVLYWYGVPKGYENLQVAAIKVGGDSRLVKLVKANDCPEDLLQFECATSATGSFSKCANIVAKSSSAIRIRAVCAQAKGPELNINSRG
jgi:hypothetical protein